MDFRSTLKWIIRVSVLSTVSVVLISAALFAWLQTGTGRRQIQDWAEDILSVPGKRHVSFKGLSGLIPFEIHLDEMLMADAGGPILLMNKASLRWSPLSLFRGIFHIHTIEIESMSVNPTRPGPAKGREEKTSQSHTFMDLPLQHVRINRFLVGKLSLINADTGPPAVFKAEGNFTPRSGEEGWTGFLHLNRMDHGGKVALTAILSQDSPEILVNLEVDEKAEGLFPMLFGISRPVCITLHGEGFFESWEATLRVSIPGLAETKTDMMLSFQNTLKMAAQGILKSGPGLLPEKINGLVCKESRFSFDMELDRENRLIISPVTFVSGGTHIKLHTAIDLNRMDVEGRYDIEIADLSVIKKMINMPCSGEFTSRGRFKGPIFQPHISTELLTKDLSVEGFNLSRWEGNYDLAFPDSLRHGFPGLHIQGNGTMEDISVSTKTNPSKVFPEKALQWKLDTQISASSEIQIREVTLSGKSFRAGIFGQIQPSGMDSTVDLSVHIPELQALSDFVDYDLPGSYHMQATLKGDTALESVTGTFQSKWELNGQMDHRISSFVGKELSCKGDFDLLNARQLTVSHLSIESMAGSFTAGGAMDLSTMRLDAAWELGIPKIDYFSKGLKQDLKGALAANGTAKGPLDKMTLNIHGVGEDILVEGIRINQIKASAQMDHTAQEAKGNLVLEIQHADTKGRGRTDFLLKESLLRLSDVSMKTDWGTLDGALDISLDQGLAKGSIQVKCDDMSKPASLFNHEISGRLNAKARLDITDSDQEIQFKLTGDDLYGEFGQAQHLILTGHLFQLRQSPNGNLSMTLDDAMFKDMRFSSLVATVNGDNRHGDFSSSFSCIHPATSKITVSGSYLKEPDTFSVILKKCQGLIDRFPLELQDPLKIETTENHWRIDPFKFLVDQGEINGRGTCLENNVEIYLEVRRLPLDLMALTGFTGSAGGEIHLTGNPTNPHGTVLLRVDELGFNEPAYAHLPPATLQARAMLKDTRVHITADIEGFSEDAIRLDMAFPLELRVIPFHAHIIESGKMNGNLFGSLDLKPVFMLMDLPEQEISGRMKIDLSVSGTVKDPAVNGGVHVQNGYYENIRTGTILKKGDIKIDAENAKLVIKQGIMENGKGGHVEISGWVDLSSVPEFPFHIEIQPKKATLIHHDYVTATLGGNMTISGVLKSISAKGNLEILIAEIHIPDQISRDVVELEVKEIPPVKNARQEKKGTENNITMDLSVTGPGQIFVRGRGLDSEWRGELQIQGNAKTPVISGNITVVRGFFNFLGKRFSLKEGRVDLYGALPPSPTLDLLAENQTRDLIIFLRISGDLTAPRIEMTSEPALPEDEILSRMMFGRSLSQISPLQALQLVKAVNRLAGGGGFDILDNTRKLLGIDQLEITQSEETASENALGNAALRVGKYLHEDIYVTVEKGMSEESGKVSVEVEVLPNITVESEIKENAESGVGLKWRWNY